MPLGSGPWPTIDPFLFCVHHLDAYPESNGAFGPDPQLLRGRRIGQDFGGVDGWNMYHGSTVPGFPQHPHRGFETVTVTRRGLVDHADSMGAAARYGSGDVQWMTAGSGIMHSEMFPLLDEADSNTLELFQIWLNLASANKMVEPHFAMFWADQVPHFVEPGVDVAVVSGTLGDVTGRSAPPASWASDAASDVAIWTVKLSEGATWTLPPTAGDESSRMLYFFDGNRLDISGTTVDSYTAAVVTPNRSATVTAVDADAECLVLQGRPIGEPVVQYGPFVMNTKEEIQQAFADYQRTQFGKWSWPVPDPTHGPVPDRFARHADGRLEFEADQVAEQPGGPRSTFS